MLERHLISFFAVNLIQSFNNTDAQILVSIYHMAFILRSIAFWRENVKTLPSLTQRYNGRN